jgi:hypothetical protein
VIGFAAGIIEKVVVFRCDIQLLLNFVLGPHEPSVIEEHLLGRCALGCLYTSEYSLLFENIADWAFQQRRNLDVSRLSGKISCCGFC